MKNYETLLERLPKFLIKPDPDIYLSDNFVVVDFETTTNNGSPSPYDKDNRVVFASWQLGKDHPEYTDKNNGTFAVLGNEFTLSTLVDHLEQADFVVAHNAKFELGWLDRCGFDYKTALVFDTMIAEHVLSGNRRWEVGLDACLKRRGWAGKSTVVSKMMKGGICPSEIPTAWLVSYGIKDTLDETKLFLDQRAALKEHGLLQVQFTRCIFTPVIVDIEQRGMHLDKERVTKVYINQVNKMLELEQKLAAISQGVNLNSGKQLGELLFNKLNFNIPNDYRGNPLLTPKGVPKTDVETIKMLRCRTKDQRLFKNAYLDLNRISTTISKYLKKLYDLVEERDDKLLFAVLNQTRTQTHRLSSTGAEYKMQLQNIQRDLKPLFCARTPGWFIGEADESQLEYRVAVFLGNDESGLNDILNKVDAHGFTASIVFKEDWENPEISKDEKKKIRTEAKSRTFKPLNIAA
jgi:DNA polymerase I-like protein with 3'-5' exonuclease and polymerase domains